MALLDEVATYLQTQAVAGLPGSTVVTASGWTLAKGYLPEAPDKVVALFETGGRANEQNAVTGLLDRPTFQVRVRSSVLAYSTARTKIEAVRTALELVGNESLSSRYYAGILSETAPLSLGLDANKRPHLAMNFAALRSRTT